MIDLRDAVGMYVGTKKVKKVYLGNKLVKDFTIYTPPVDEPPIEPPVEEPTPTIYVQVVESEPVQEDVLLNCTGTLEVRGVRRKRPYVFNFYSDAARTVPMSVTNLQLNIRAGQKSTYGGAFTYATSQITVNGTSYTYSGSYLIYEAYTVCDYAKAYFEGIVIVDPGAYVVNQAAYVQPSPPVYINPPVEEPEEPVEPPVTTYSDFRAWPYPIGYAIDWDKTSTPTYLAEFTDATIITPENGTNPGHINPGLKTGFTKYVPGADSLRYNLTEMISIFNWAQANGKKIHYAHGIWYTGVAAHVTAIATDNPGNEKAALTVYVKEYFAYILPYIQTNWPGLVVSMNVVNEAVNNASQGQSGSARASVWATWFTLDEMFELAFTEVTRHTSTIKRFINDYTQETSNSGQSNRYVQIINDLHAKNIIVNGRQVRVDGMGFQFHSDLSKASGTAFTTVKARLKMWADMGLLVALTELDTVTSFPYNAEEVANWYDKIIFGAYEVSVPPALRWCVIMWSPNDRSSHLNNGAKGEPGTANEIKNFPAMYDWYSNRKLVKDRIMAKNLARL
jgi:GH35 family endo-1,4-beta-xylanase